MTAKDEAEKILIEITEADFQLKTILEMTELMTAAELPAIGTKPERWQIVSLWQKSKKAELVKTATASLIDMDSEEDTRRKKEEEDERNRIREEQRQKVTEQIQLLQQQMEGLNRQFETLDEEIAINSNSLSNAQATVRREESQHRQDWAIPPENFHPLQTPRSSVESMPIPNPMQRGRFQPSQYFPDRYRYETPKRFTSPPRQQRQRNFNYSREEFNTPDGKHRPPMGFNDNTFDPDKDNAELFLRTFKDILCSQKCSNIEIVKQVIPNILKGDARTWWYSTCYYIVDVKEFIKMFKSTYVKPSDLSNLTIDFQKRSQLPDEPPSHYVCVKENMQRMINQGNPIDEGKLVRDIKKGATPAFRLKLDIKNAKSLLEAREAAFSVESDMNDEKLNERQNKEMHRYSFPQFAPKVWQTQHFVKLGIANAHEIVKCKEFLKENPEAQYFPRFRPKNQGFTQQDDQVERPTPHQQNNNLFRGNYNNRGMRGGFSGNRGNRGNFRGRPGNTFQRNPTSHGNTTEKQQVVVTAGQAVAGNTKKKMHLNPKQVEKIARAWNRQVKVRADMVWNTELDDYMNSGYYEQENWEEYQQGQDEEAQIFEYGMDLESEEEVEQISQGSTEESSQNQKNL